MKPRLHSDKAHPKSIIHSLQRRYEMGRDRGYEPAWTIDLRKLRGARGRVREYLSALHSPDEADGRTPFQLFWSAIANRHEPAASSTPYAGSTCRRSSAPAPTRSKRVPMR